MCWLLGHNFGVIQSDGFQYCSKCGEAKKSSTPHPCANGHIWVDEYEQQFTTRRTCVLTGGVNQGLEIQTFQKCKTCGTKRSITT